MSETFLPFRPRRDDPLGFLTVQKNVEALADELDKLIHKFKQGSAVVAAGNTFVDVSHSLGSSQYQAVVTPTVDPVQRWWISNKTSSSFRINLSAAAGGGGVSFDWMVKQV